MAWHDMPEMARRLFRFASYQRFCLTERRWCHDDEYPPIMIERLVADSIEVKRVSTRSK